MTGSPDSTNDPAVIRDLLTTPATWAVVGLSDNAERTAYRIASFLRDRLVMHVIPCLLYTSPSPRD